MTVNDFVLTQIEEAIRNNNVNYIEAIFYNVPYNVPYDEYIDINDTNLTADTAIDIQLSPTLQLDEELMLLGTCQVDDANNKISYLNDKREFGNISEEQFSNSAINFITAGDKYFHQNGVIKGFDIISSNIFNNNFAISIQGGSTLTNGKIINFRYSYCKT